MLKQKLALLCVCKGHIAFQSEEDSQSSEVMIDGLRLEKGSFMKDK